MLLHVWRPFSLAIGVKMSVRRSDNLPFIQLEVDALHSGLFGGMSPVIVLWSFGIVVKVGAMPDKV